MEKEKKYLTYFFTTDIVIVECCLQTFHISWVNHRSLHIRQIENMR